MSNFYLDLLGVNKIVDKINTSLRGRIKYKGLLALIPAGGTTRTNWNDIAPCIEGHAYILTGLEGQFIELNDVRYMTGDMIFTTNEVVIKTDGTVSANVEVKKISGGSAIIDEKTIVQNDDATYAPEGALKTEIGGWKELAVAKIEFIETDKKELGQIWTKTVTKPGKLDDILAAHTVGELIPAKVYPADDPLDVRPFNLTYEGETPAGSAHYRMATTLAAFEGNIEFYAADADNVTIVGTFTGNRMCDNIDKTILVCILDVSYTYHSLDTKYIEKDNLTIVSEEVTGHEVEVLRAKTAIEITSFPVLAKTETMYRLTQEVTVGDKKYAKGLYVYDLSDPADPKWVSVGGSLVDEKTIRSTNDDGAIVPLYTQVGGWKKKINPLSIDFGSTQTYTFDSTDSKWVSTFNYTYGEKPSKDTDYLTVDYQTSGSLSYSGQLNKRQETADEIIFTLGGPQPLCIFINNLHDNTVTLKFAANALTETLVKKSVIAHVEVADEIHPLKSEYINVDKISLVNEEGITGQLTGLLHARSAIEVSTFPTTDILEQTIYRLTQEQIISGKKYAKGLYVYDKTGTDPVWLSVGGSEVDEKTVRSLTDAGELVPLYTQIGGWKEGGHVPTIDYGSKLSGFTFVDNAWEITFEYTYGTKPSGSTDYVYVSYNARNGAVGTAYSGKLADRFETTEGIVYANSAVSPSAVFINLNGSNQAKLRFSVPSIDFELMKHVAITYLDSGVPEVIHPAKSEYINVDEVTIVKKDIGSGDETNKFRAKSALEVSSLSIYLPLTETIYRLTEECTIGTKKYAPGLYVYDKLTDPDNPQWLSVGGSEVDNKTILDHDLTGESKPLYTAVGGWSELQDVTKGPSVTFTNTAIDDHIWEAIMDGTSFDINNYTTFTTDKSFATLLIYEGTTLIKKYENIPFVSHVSDQEWSFEVTNTTPEYSYGIYGYILGSTYTIKVSTINEGAHFVSGNSYNGKITFTLKDTKVYHKSDAHFVDIDLATITLDDDEKLRSNAIIIVNVLPTEGLLNVIYYLNTKDSSHDVGNYVYRDSAWILFNDSILFENVVTLPTTDIKPEKLYRVVSTILTEVTTWKLKDTATGWTIEATGLNDGTVVHTWAEIEADQASYFNVVLEESPTGTVYRFKQDGTVHVSNVLPEEKVVGVKHYYKEKWNDFSKEPIINVGLNPRPTDPIDYSLYKRKEDVYTLTARYNLTAASVTAGYSVQSDGLHFTDPVTHVLAEVVPWEDVELNWAATYSTLFEQDDTNGIVYRYVYNGENKISYDEPLHPLKILLEFYDPDDGWKILYDSLSNGSGTSDYNSLSNKPKINSVTLEDNKTSEQLSIFWYGTKDEYDAILVKNLNTTYYIVDDDPILTLKDYDILNNKPKINGVELIGNKNTEELKIAWHGTQTEYDALPSINDNTFYVIEDGTSLVSTDDYLNLGNKPKINGVELTGDKSSTDLNIYSKTEVDNIVASMRSINVVSEEPSSPSPNTLYYISANLQPPYNVVLFNSNLVRIPMGTSEIDMSQYQTRTLNTLTTASKNIAGAINLIHDRVGSTVLTTLNKNATAAINELNNNIGSLTSLKTDSKSSVVSATNEVFDKFGTVKNIEVVSAMPTTPTANVLYIVV